MSEPDLAHEIRKMDEQLRLLTSVVAELCALYVAQPERIAAAMAKIIKPQRPTI